MTGVITRLIQSAATSDLQTSDLSLLRQHKSHLDALALNLKGLSPAIVALDKQKALLAEYKSHLLPWQTAVASQYGQAWKKLVVRLLIITLIICLLIGIGEVSRRLAFRRVQDPNRRAGVAVSLQNVILASLGYLLLVGKRGIRIGERVQVSGITGDVINMGLLQFQLKEFDVQKQRFTGHVATFSNSLVFVYPATGLVKLNSVAEKAADA